MTKQAISPEQSYTCPKCGVEWRMLKGDTNESTVRCMACCERFQIGAHLTKRTPDKAAASAFPRSLATYNIVFVEYRVDPPCG